jgi:hypothetical protein
MFFFLKKKLCCLFGEILRAQRATITHKMIVYIQHFIVVRMNDYQPIYFQCIYFLSALINILVLREDLQTGMSLLLSVLLLFVSGSMIFHALSVFITCIFNVKKKKINHISKRDWLS